MSSVRTKIPPGQRVVEGFPRFGTHLNRRPPRVPEGYAITIDAPGLAISLTLADLGLTDIKSMTFSVDGATFYVLGSGPEVEGSAPQPLASHALKLSSL